MGHAFGDPVSVEIAERKPEDSRKVVRARNNTVPASAFEQPDENSWNKNEQQGDAEPIRASFARTSRRRMSGTGLPVLPSRRISRTS